MKRLCLASILVSTSVLCTAAPAAKMQDGVLVNEHGMTLYTFDKDTAGKSNCNAACATLWPPAIAARDAQAEGDMSIITRDDGAMQWAHKGKPVYTFVKDVKAGDRTGDNVKEVWHVVK